MRYGAMVAALVVPASLGCSGSDPAGADAVCVAAVQVNGVAFILAGAEDPLEASAVSPDPYAEVTHSIGCDDTVLTPGDGFEDVDEDGESNFLPVGSTLHAIDGRSTSTALAVMWGGEWQVVAARDGS